MKDACKCGGQDTSACQLLINQQGTSATCTSITTQECRCAIASWAEKYKNAPNANECKKSDIAYKSLQDANTNCTKTTKGMTKAIPISSITLQI